MPVDNPWSYLQPNDVERFGPAILDPAEQKRWSSALFLGGLSYMWQRAAAFRELIFLHLALEPGDRVLLLGEALEGSKFPEDVRARIRYGELVCVDYHRGSAQRHDPAAHRPQRQARHLGIYLHPRHA